MSQSTTSRIVIVGGGHNGLTAAAYLARAGHRVLVLERRHLVGGAAITEEIHPGFRCSTASYVVSLLRPEIIADLGLKSHGFSAIPMTHSFGVFAGGKSLLLTGDAQRDRAEVGQFSNRDFDSMQRFGTLMHEIGDFVNAQMLRPPPKVKATLGNLPTLARLGWSFYRLSPSARRLLTQILGGTLLGLLERWFDSDAVRSMYAATATAGNFVSLRQPGSALNLMHLGIGETDGIRGRWALAKGGMGAITQALARSAQQCGAEIRLNAEVERILVEDKRVSGVQLVGGEVIDSSLVLANTDPHRTFLKLLNPSDLDDDFRSDIQQWRMGSGTFRMNLALSGLPSFACRPTRNVAAHHAAFVRIVPKLQTFEDAYLAAIQGRLPEIPIIDAVIPTALDDSLAPRGAHILSVLCQHYPYDLADGESWDDARDRVADHIIDVMEDAMPGLKGQVLARQVMSPLDLERIFGLTRGDVYHGRLDPDQLFAMRPHPSAAQYRTPIMGLYLCGAGAHPGGGVSGAPGHNAAKTVLRDLRFQRGA